MPASASSSTPSQCPLALPILLALALIALGCAKSVAQPPPPKLYVYSSVGDNQWVSDWAPLDSKASIDGLFEYLAQAHGAKRMYWRWVGDRMQNFRTRRENVLYWDFWENWVRHLYEQVGTDDLAVAAAKRNGMEIYIFDGIFEHAAQGDAGGCGMFPYESEDNLRIEHPEWRPVDRWGERVCAGPIEFCYPEARKALVDRYVRNTVDHGFDGIGFYTYVENMSIRYDDEFGFNEPIVAEFKKRYGVDIRTQPFDKQAWYRLRGEYFTQFLRELHAALAAKGKKLTMTLQANNPNYPQPWYGTQTGKPGAGMIYLDWEAWATEGIVDELCIWSGADKEKLATRMLEVCRAKPVELTVLGVMEGEQWQRFYDAGFTPWAVVSPGGGADGFAPTQASLAGLNSDDWKVRAQVLYEITAGTLKADAAIVEPLVKDDPHVLVRRQAVLALDKLAEARSLPVIETALEDPEISVRIQAIKALGKVYGPETPGKILAAVGKDGSFQMKMVAATSLAAMKEKALTVLTDALKSRSESVRETAVRALDASDLPAAIEPLIGALSSDTDYRVRWWAISGLAGWKRPAVIRALRGALADPDPAVQLWAAQKLGDMAPGMPARAAEQTRAALEAIFPEYGEGCRRPDAAWGWRVIGNAIKAFGQPGLDFLEGMRTQTKDKWLAWYAYEVVHVPQEPTKAVLCDEQEAVETHAKYAPPFPGRR
jgi:HEAT repeat protein